MFINFHECLLQTSSNKKTNMEEEKYFWYVIGSRSKTSSAIFYRSEEESERETKTWTSIYKTLVKNITKKLNEIDRENQTKEGNLPNFITILNLQTSLGHFNM